MKALFGPGPASDATYIAIRDRTDPRSTSYREYCEELWRSYEPYADLEFTTELRSNFAARYWEMYLTVSFVLSGYTITCPKPGPDVGIMHKEPAFGLRQPHQQVDQCAPDASRPIVLGSND